MNWKDKTVIRILFLIAKMVSDPEWRKDLQDMSNHISAYRESEPSK